MQGDDEGLALLGKIAYDLSRVGLEVADRFDAKFQEGLLITSID
jgi:hypothetical protein